MPAGHSGMQGIAKVLRAATLALAAGAALVPAPVAAQSVPATTGELSAARAGAGLIVAGLQEDMAALDDRAIPGLARKADNLEAEIDEIQELLVPARTSRRELQRAFRRLLAMTTGKSDPRYPDVVEEVGAALAAVSGEDPTTGKQVDRSYPGLARALRLALELIEEEAVRVRALRGDLQDQRAVLVKALEGARALAGALDRVAAGAAGSAQALASIAAGATQLETGLTAGLQFIVGSAIPGQQDGLSAAIEFVEGVEALHEPVKVADPAVRRAFRLLERSTTLKTDPLYPSVRAAVARAHGAIRGVDPRDGNQRRRSFHGIRAELTDVEGRLEDGIANDRNALDTSRELRDGLTEATVGASMVAWRLAVLAARRPATAGG